MQALSGNVSQVTQKTLEQTAGELLSGTAARNGYIKVESFDNRNNEIPVTASYVKLSGQTVVAKAFSKYTTTPDMAIFTKEKNDNFSIVSPKATPNDVRMLSLPLLKSRGADTSLSQLPSINKRAVVSHTKPSSAHHTMVPGRQPVKATDVRTEKNAPKPDNNTGKNNVPVTTAESSVYLEDNEQEDDGDGDDGDPEDPQEPGDDDGGGGDGEGDGDDDDSDDGDGDDDPETDPANVTVDGPDKIIFENSDGYSYYLTPGNNYIMPNGDIVEVGEDGSIASVTLPAVTVSATAVPGEGETALEVVGLAGDSQSATVSITKLAASEIPGELKVFGTGATLVGITAGTAAAIWHIADNGGSTSDYISLGIAALAGLALLTGVGEAYEAVDLVISVGSTAWDVYQLAIE